MAGDGNLTAEHAGDIQHHRICHALGRLLIDSENIGATGVGLNTIDLLYREPKTVNIENDHFWRVVSTMTTGKEPTARARANAQQQSQVDSAGVCLEKALQMIDDEKIDTRDVVHGTFEMITQYNEISTRNDIIANGEPVASSLTKLGGRVRS